MKKTMIGIVTIVTVFFMMLTTSVNAASLNADKTEMSKGDIVTLTLKLDQQVESVQFVINYDTSKFEYVDKSVNTGFASPIVNAANGELRVSSFDVYSTTDTVTMQFKALENGKDVGFSISETEFIMGDTTGETVVNPTLNVTITEPDDTEEPTDPEQPGDTEEPTDPEQPGDTEEPTDPEQPGDTEEPTNPEQPGDTEEPTDPEQPGDTEEPTNPEQPSTPENPSTGETSGDNQTQESTNSEEENNGEYIDEDGDVITRLPQTGSIVPSIIISIAALGLAGLITFRVIKNRK